MSLFVIFKFPAVPSPVRPDARREQNPDDKCRHPLEDITGDTAGGKSLGAQDKVSEEQNRAAPHGKPECSSGLPLLLHSGIPPGRLL
ncbi:unnamed protein product, partial [Staurois parvus]